MSNPNSYGFDFLRTEHTLDNVGQPKQEIEPGSAAAGLFLGDESEKYKSSKNKPDLEKQFDILAFLQAHRGSGSCLQPSVIYRATGIDLDENVNVAAMLQKNPKIKIEMVPDPENPALSLATYAYQAKYSNVRDRTSLLAQINRMTTSGVPVRDLLDSYSTVEQDLKSLITAGDIIAVENKEDKDKILFPRGDLFLVELDGIVSLPPIVPTKKKQEEEAEPKKEEPSAGNTKSKNGNNNNGSKKKEEDSKDNNNKKNTPAGGNNGEKNQTTKTTSGDDDEPNNKNPQNGSPSTNKEPSNSEKPDGEQEQTEKEKQEEETKKKTKPPVYVVETDIDPTTQVRRGEAIQVGGQWFRVSSAVREGLPLSEQPFRAQAPLSVVSLTDLSKRNEVDGYVRPFTSKTLPLDHELKEDPGQTNLTRNKEAREKLSKLWHGLQKQHRGGGGMMATTKGSGFSQLLGSLAHASNPTTLATSLTSSMKSSSAGSNMMRKRPNTKMSSSSTTTASSSPTAAGGGNNASTSTKNTQQELQQVTSDPSLCLYTHAVRHGCTKDVREMYLQTRTLVPESDHDLHAILLKHKLLEPGEMLRRQRLAKSSNVDNDGKPKKRRYYERKNQRKTNIHLEGTEIGAILAMAAEKQKQGKSVGDGGM